VPEVYIPVNSEVFCILVFPPLFNEFQFVIRAYEFGNASDDEKIRQGIDNIMGFQLPIQL